MSAENELPASFWRGLQQAARDIAEGWDSEGEGLGPSSSLTDSPIERLLFVTLVMRLRLYGQPFRAGRGSVRWPAPLGSGGLEIITQAQIGEFRVDFLVRSQEYPREVRFVIECDGHDFHERTKEQAARDRSRDRRLSALGYTVLRYTGSEIYRDPWACAQDVFEHFQGAWVDQSYLDYQLKEPKE